MTYTEYLKGKSVVVVGPAGYTRGQQRGPEFGAYDLVVRINDGVHLALEFPEDLGTRTDIVYHNLHLTPPTRRRMRQKLHSRGYVLPEFVHEWNRHGVKYLIGPAPVAYRKNVGLAEGLIAKCQQTFREVPNDICCMPFSESRLKDFEEFGGYISVTVGLMACIDLMQYPIRKLFVAGMTCLNSPYYEEYCPDLLWKKRLKEHAMQEPNERGGHKMDWELKVLLAFWEHDDRFVPDTPLRELFGAKHVPSLDRAGLFGLGGLEY